MSNRYQNRHLRQQQHDLIQSFGDAGQVTSQTKQHHNPKRNLDDKPDVHKSGADTIDDDRVNLNGMLSGIVTKAAMTTTKPEISGKAIVAACIEVIGPSENECITKTSDSYAKSTTTTPNETDEHADNSSSLSKLFAKKKQLGGRDAETACKQNEPATESPSGGEMPNRRDSILDVFKKRLSSLNLSEEEYGNANDKTEFDTDSDSDSNDNDGDDEYGEGDINLKIKKNGNGDDSIGLDIFGDDSRFAIDNGWVSYSNQAA